MKNKIIVILLCLIFFLFACQQVNARSLQDINFVFVKEDAIKSHCKVDWLPLGCLEYPNKIILRIDNYISQEMKVFALYHEIGHWFMQDVSEAEYRKAFNNIENLKTIKETAADIFAYLLMEKEKEIKLLTIEQIKFYLKIIL